MSEIITPTSEVNKIRFQQEIEMAYARGAIAGLKHLELEINKENSAAPLTGPAIELMIKQLRWSFEKTFRTKFAKKN